jgi:sugar transferase EpsL
MSSSRCRKGVARHLKHLMDLAVALIALALLSPVMVAVSFCIRAKMGSPVLFRQQRPGLNGVPFTLLKFRTMKETRGPAGNPLPDSQRVTPFGRFLRTCSLDELPELINVLRGEMSLVGPRPLLMRYLDRYTPEQMRRHGVKPGITGWAQTNGRNAISWEEKFALDLWYIDNWSLWLDLKIFGMTVLAVLKRDGISHPGHATMEEYQGVQPIDPDTRRQ